MLYRYLFKTNTVIEETLIFSSVIIFNFKEPRVSFELPVFWEQVSLQGGETMSFGLLANGTRERIVQEIANEIKNIVT